MGKFLGDLNLKWVGVINKTVIWELLTPLSYITNSNKTIIVPIGFRTDLASIPRILWVFLPPDWKYTKAAIIHDYLLENSDLSTQQINRIFQDGMTDLNVNNQINWLMFNAVCFWFWFKKI